MKTNSKQDYLEYQAKYESISGLSLPYEYLEESDVYLCKRKGEIVGGFILGSKAPFRTIETFVSEENAYSVSRIFQKDNFCEVCCFWIDRRYRKRPIYNAKCWLKMAYAIRRQPRRYILFGTNSKGLAKMYNYPKVSLLLHEDNVRDRHTYIFFVKRKYFISGTLEIVFSKWLHRSRNRDLIINSQDKNSILHELST